MQSARLSQKQQRFVDGVIAGKSNTQAYLDAYGGAEASARANAARLIAKDSIAVSLVSRREKVAAKAELTLEAHLNRLNELATAAAESKQYSAAVTAETNRGKASGFYVERTETAHSGTIRVEIVREGKRRKTA